MIISQLKLCHDQLNQGGDRLMGIRANYGVGIIPSMLGCPVFIMPEEMKTLPNVYPLEGGLSAIRSLAEGASPGFSKGWGPKVLEVAEVFREIRETYPVIAAFVRIDHPDSQGPLDICELLWGSDIFYALVDEPELAHKLLGFVTDFYISFIDHWFALLPPVDGYHSFFSRLHKGDITIRNDSLMNLSPQMHREFAMPYDQRILSHYRGGMVHFCGKGDHFIESLSTLEGLYAVDLSQPHLNDMERSVCYTLDKNINLHTSQYESAGIGNHNWGRLSM
jgi:hypothetical protein